MPQVPQTFKCPDFDKYDWRSCPFTHFKLYGKAMAQSGYKKISYWSNCFPKDLSMQLYHGLPSSNHTKSSCGWTWLDYLSNNISSISKLHLIKKNFRERARSLVKAPESMLKGGSMKPHESNPHSLIRSMWLSFGSIALHLL